ncbi:hypothetical protein EAS68_06690 [Legionella jordanis]|uniref:outer membrane protein n=1 Tax=Legionella jordanis TaxID=456 RepID=UPI000EFF87D7|nr:outer membrane beta-barrel protein [Legionella jordanis]RMX19118.1 hypothetical protein EAS68_06690 [Legionella jordanis]
MKTYLKFGLAGFMLASSSAFSDVPPDGWYGGLFGTLSKTPSLDFTIPYADFSVINTALNFVGSPILTSPAGSVKYSLGYGGGVDIGYRLCGFRFEGELLYDHNPYDSISVGGVTLTDSQNTALAFPFSYLTVGGKTDMGAAFFNIYYDFYNFDEDVSWIPYIGLGLGYARVKNTVDLDVIVPPNGIAIATPGGAINLGSLSETTSTPAGQIIAGISYQFSDQFSAGLDYRYVTTKTISILDERFTVHSLNLNFNFWFPNQ